MVIDCSLAMRPYACERLPALPHNLAWVQSTVLYVWSIALGKVTHMTYLGHLFPFFSPSLFPTLWAICTCSLNHLHSQPPPPTSHSSHTTTHGHRTPSPATTFCLTVPPFTFPYLHLPLPNLHEPQPSHIFVNFFFVLIMALCLYRVWLSSMLVFVCVLRGVGTLLGFAFHHMVWRLHTTCSIKVLTETQDA